MPLGKQTIVIKGELPATLKVTASGDIGSCATDQLKIATDHKSATLECTATKAGKLALAFEHDGTAVKTENLTFHAAKINKLARSYMAVDAPSTSNQADIVGEYLTADIKMTASNSALNCAYHYKSASQAHVSCAAPAVGKVDLSFSQNGSKIGTDQHLTYVKVGAPQYQNKNYNKAHSQLYKGMTYDINVAVDAPETIAKLRVCSVGSANCQDNAQKMAKDARFKAPAADAIKSGDFVPSGNAFKMSDYRASQLTNTANGGGKMFNVYAGDEYLGSIQVLTESEVPAPACKLAYYPHKGIYGGQNFYGSDNHANLNCQLPEDFKEQVADLFYIATAPNSGEAKWRQDYKTSEGVYDFSATFDRGHGTLNANQTVWLATAYPEIYVMLPLKNEFGKTIDFGAAQKLTAQDLKFLAPKVNDTGNAFLVLDYASGKVTQPTTSARPCQTDESQECHYSFGVVDVQNPDSVQDVRWTKLGEHDFNGVPMLCFKDELTGLLWAVPKNFNHPWVVGDWAAISNSITGYKQNMCDADLVWRLPLATELIGITEYKETEQAPSYSEGSHRKSDLLDTLADSQRGIWAVDQLRKSTDKLYLHVQAHSSKTNLHVHQWKQDSITAQHSYVFVASPKK